MTMMDVVRKQGCKLQDINSEHIFHAFEDPWVDFAFQIS
jgi:hypothetical protein